MSMEDINKFKVPLKLLCGAACAVTLVLCQVEKKAKGKRILPSKAVKEGAVAATTAVAAIVLMTVTEGTAENVSDILIRMFYMRRTPPKFLFVDVLKALAKNDDDMYNQNLKHHSLMEVMMMRGGTIFTQPGWWPHKRDLIFK
ncbi:hypothetical protein SLEP1_g22104 [Rubroshorea leprosula]|uniref:Uncharacterized protein n=1 Tax=Rubroshorea leprosula TaxID=152421 RepID=A0AAV5JE91_9ROSI|nr:hypothetical protein SLEP1_g22104 [Rubroshorea leprosula]